ncbi:substrate-binding domain-containing protein [Pararhizobium sp. DWP3-4]|uniref:substrate-binding domain-containing protein n=1 Tax=Pararhizobium sp. DWP3-4 TaxID=2804565 RepID=UPI003CEF6294
MGTIENRINSTMRRCWIGGLSLVAMCVATTTANAACNPKNLERAPLPSWIQQPDVRTLKTRGNVGEMPSSYLDVAISPEQVQDVCTKKLKAAFLNWSAGAYNDAIVQGAKDALEAMNIELVAVTNYNYNQTQLANDVRDVMALRPDFIFYSGIDPTADRAALQPAVDAGVGVVSFANAPGGWTAGRPSNFITLLSYDTQGNGALLAREVAKKFPDGGKLGMIYFDANYKIVNEREQGFQDEIAKTDIEMAVRSPMSSPNSTQDITSAMLARNSDLDVIFAPWDLPADGVIAALNAAGSKIAIAHIDLGFTGATQIACNKGPIFAMSSQLVYEWGRTGAIAAALHELGQPVPPYVMVPIFTANKDNLKEAWDIAYGATAELPAAAQKCLAAE